MKRAEEKAKGRWGTQSGSGQAPEYDRRRFYIDSTNEYNHYATIRPFNKTDADEMGAPKSTKLPPEFVARIWELVDDPRTEYRSFQDFIRDSIHHRLHDVTEMQKDNDFLPTFNRQIYRQALARIQREDQGFSEEMGFFDAAAERFFKSQNPHGIADIIEEVRKNPPILRHLREWRENLRRWEDWQQTVERTRG